MLQTHTHTHRSHSLPHFMKETNGTRTRIRLRRRRLSISISDLGAHIRAPSYVPNEGNETGDSRVNWGV